MADQLPSPTSAPGRPDLPLSSLTSTHTSQFLPHSRHGPWLRPRRSRHRAGGRGTGSEGESCRTRDACVGRSASGGRAGGPAAWAFGFQQAERSVGCSGADPAKPARGLGLRSQPPLCSSRLAALLLFMNTVALRERVARLPRGEKKMLKIPLGTSTVTFLPVGKIKGGRSFKLLIFLLNSLPRKISLQVRRGLLVKNRYT